MSDVIPSVNLTINKQNNGGYTVNINTVIDGTNKYENVAFTSELEVGEYIASFLLQLPVPKSDLFELTNPTRIPNET
jgi:hypothetical protein